MDKVLLDRDNVIVPADARPTRRQRTRLSSVTTAVRLLKLFSVQDHELGISELSKRLGVAKSTVHRLASALLDEGLLEQNPENNRYRLGVALFGLGTLVRRRMEVVAEAKTFLTDLRAQTGENVRLAILNGTNVVYVNDFEGPHPVRLRSSIGLSKPAYCTAEGIVLLTGQPRETIDAMLAGEIVVPTPRAANDATAIRARIDEARRLGYAVDDEESENGMTCVAAPVHGGDGRVVAGIGVAGPRTRLRKRTIPALAARVVATAAQISARFGYGLEMRLGA
jgi:IclR family transcriptional regulator, KDG regulon repressor